MIKKTFLGKHTSTVIKVIITIVFLFIMNRTVSLTEFKSLLKHIKPIHILLVLLLSFFNLHFHVSRWIIILRYMELKPDKKSAWYSILWGTLLAFITPGRVGELFRGVGTVKGDSKDAMFGVVLDKLFILTTVFIFGTVGAIYQFSILGVLIPGVIVKSTFLVFVLALVLFVILFNGKVISNENHIAFFFNKTVAGLHRLFRPAGFKAMGLSFGAHLCLILQTVILLHMFGCFEFEKVLISAVQGYGILPFLSVSIGELGVREGAVSFFMENLNVVCNNEISLKGAALGMSLFIVIANLVLPSIAGLLWNLFKQNPLQENA